MIVTTTPSVDGRDVTAYLGVVSAHVVAGTNVFSDLAASFSDIFGGRSDSYGRQVASIYSDALDGLRASARRRRASAVVGVSVDVDEISGGGKSMLMITATGTAVKLSPVIAASGSMGPEDGGHVIDHREVIDADRATRLARGNPGDPLDESDVEFLVERRDPAMLGRLLAAVSAINDSAGYHVSASEFMSRRTVKDAARIIDAMDVKDVGADLRAAYKEARGNVSTFLHGRIANLRAGSLDDANGWLESEDVNVKKKSFNLAFLPISFSSDDVSRLRVLSDKAERAFPDTSRVEEESSMMRTREVPICGFCEGRIIDGYCVECKRDPNGFERSEMRHDAAALHMRSRADALEKLLSSGSDANGSPDLGGRGGEVSQAR